MRSHPCRLLDPQCIWGRKVLFQAAPHMAGRGLLTNLFLSQVLGRWCTSPRTIEVLMNTYCVVQLPEEAKGLVPPEILQVSARDP